MLLVVDVGNTNIVIGLYEGKNIIRLENSYGKNRTSDEYGLLFEQIFKHQGLCIEDVKDVIISSVVPTLMHTLSSMGIKYF